MKVGDVVTKLRELEDIGASVKMVRLINQYLLIVILNWNRFKNHFYHTLKYMKN